ncbi:hypothetical protein [Cellulomonas cellasea]|uniref:Uncharacterized protein n=1 Tax=Cellulomonas cellasea TaxID=43670 RepID=A0A7W4UFP2_9CELL|nr:hypothetical protein [Cellulomonas cellasea]MBB2922954.1 hypothetical protein [Cellulomonas cellasea]
MSLFLIVLAAALLVWWVARLVAVVREDGYGLRPPPPSHEHDHPVRA